MIKRNMTLFKWDNFFGGLWPLATLVIIYFEQITHSYAWAMAVFSACSLSTTFMEIPTGIISDRIGRKKTLIWAAVSIFICFALWALAGQYQQTWMLFAGALLWGVSDALLSGTDEALMYETMEELGRPDQFDVLYAKSNGWNQVGLGVSALLAAGVTYYFSLQTLAWLSCLLAIGQLMIAFLYIEPQKIQTYHQTTSFKHFLIAYRKLRRNRRLRFYALITIFDRAVGFASHRFESAYFSTLIPDWLINLARFCKQACGTISFFLIPYVKKWGIIPLFFGSMVASVIIRTVGVCINSAVTPFIMAGVNLFYGAGQTSGATLLQNEFSAAQRATMKSIISFMSNLVQAVTMFFLGGLADIASPRTAIFFAVLVKGLVLVSSLFVLKKTASRK